MNRQMKICALFLWLKYLEFLAYGEVNTNQPLESNTIYPIHKIVSPKSHNPEDNLKPDYAETDVTTAVTELRNRPHGDEHEADVVYPRPGPFPPDLVNATDYYKTGAVYTHSQAVHSELSSHDNHTYIKKSYSDMEATAGAQEDSDYPEYWPSPSRNVDDYQNYEYSRPDGDDYYWEHNSQNNDPISLPSVSNMSRWGDILPNMTSLVAQLCGSNYLCNSSHLISQSFRFCSPCRHCSCESVCYKRRDCCLNKLLQDSYDQLIQQETTPVDIPQVHFGCYSSSYKKKFAQNTHYALIDSCPTNFNDSYILRECLQIPPNSSLDPLKQLKAVWPVWSNGSKLFYRNRFCALCNGEDAETIQPWALVLRCTENTRLFNTRTYEAMMEEIHNSTFCELNFENPANTLPGDCTPDEVGQIDTCNATGQRGTYDPVLWHGCHHPNFHSKVMHLNITYKNMYCVLCNQHEDKAEVRGKCDYFGDIPFPLVLVMSDYLLGDVPSSSSPATNRCQCHHDELYDPYEHKCRPLRCSMTRRLENKKCVVQFTEASGLPYGFSIRLDPLDDRSIRMPSISYLHEVTHTIENVFRAKLDSVHRHGLLIQKLRVVAMAETPLLTKHFTAPVHVIAFRLKALVTLEARISSSSRLNSFENQLLGLIYAMWNLTLHFANHQMYRATPYYDPADSFIEGYYAQPTFLTSYDAVTEYILDSPLLPKYEKVRQYIPVLDTILCPQVLHDVAHDNMLKMDKASGSVHHSLSGTTVHFQYIDVLPDGNILVCADQIYNSVKSFLAPAVPENLFSASVINLSIICQTLSIISLSLVFITYCLFPELRTLPGKNTMGLVITLLLAMLTFQVGVARVELPTVCVMLGVLIHYLLLSSFTWMLVCSLHMYRIFTRLLYAHTHKTDNETWIFIKYVVITVAIPVVIIGCTMLANYLAHYDGCVLDLGYGVGICYLSNSWSLILASILPILLAVLVNLMLFVSIMLALQPVTLERRKLYRHQHQQLIVYIRMSAVTGINWLAGVVAATVDSLIIWCMFSILCGLQGVYVFVAFVCNKRVFRLYRTLLCGRSENGNSAATGSSIVTNGGKELEGAKDTQDDVDSHGLHNSARRIGEDVLED